MNNNKPRRVYILATWAHISKTGRTCSGLIKREIRDADTEAVLATGKYMAALRKQIVKAGWELVVRKKA